MKLSLSEEQLLIAESARALLAAKSPVARARELRDRRDPVGFSRELWAEMAELGWVGMLVPEAQGGSGFGNAELGILAEEAGRVLAPEPLFSTALLGASVLCESGGGERVDTILSRLAAGESIVSVAWQEGPRFDPSRIETSAQRKGSGFRIRGEKRFVPDAHVADWLVVVARTRVAQGGDGGLTLFLVDPRQPGVSIERTTLIDGRNHASLQLEDVEIAPEQVLGELHQAGRVLEPLLDRGSAFLAAELVGISLEALERTRRFLDERQQFGVKIGSFQALKHRTAQAFCACEMALSVVRGALRALDERDPQASKLASAAKAKCCEVAGLVTNEAIQMHGGIGMTDEHEIGLFLKRARVAAAQLGDLYFHRERFATRCRF